MGIFNDWHVTKTIKSERKIKQCLWARNATGDSTRLNVQTQHFRKCKMILQCDVGMLEWESPSLNIVMWTKAYKPYSRLQTILTWLFKLLNLKKLISTKGFTLLWIFLRSIPEMNLFRQIQYWVNYNYVR